MLSPAHMIRSRCSRSRRLAGSTAWPLLALVLLVFVTPWPAFAGVAVSPLQQQVTVRPGQTAEFELTLNNVQRGTRTQTARVRIAATDFAVCREGGLAFGEQRGHERSATPWLQLEAEEVSLRPGEKRTMRGTVSPPLEADGDYWAAVMVTLDGPRQAGGVQVVLRTASAVFVRVTRHTRLARPQVTSVQVELPRFDAAAGGEAASPPAGLRLALEVLNDGLVSFTGDATATLYLDGRRQAATVPLHSRRRRVLPGDSRIFEGVLAEPVPPGDYVVRFAVAPEGMEGRRAFAQSRFSVDEKLAAEWKQVSAREGPTGLRVKPELVEMRLNPGRFTSFSIGTSNESGSTMRMRIRVQPDAMAADWLAVSPESFTLAPGMHRAVSARLAVPPRASPGEYEAVIRVSAESAAVGPDTADESRTVRIVFQVSE